MSLTGRATASGLEPMSRTMSLTSHDGSIPPVHFAFVRLKGMVFLVKIVDQAKPSDPTTNPLSVSIFCHEFISIWRYSHTVQLLPADFRVLLTLDTNAVRYEEDNGVVFLAKHLMSHLRNIIDDSTKTKETWDRPARRRCRT